jgi:uncharacterized protein
VFDKRQQVQDILRTLQSVLVAYSGGVDSTLLLRVAHDTLGDAVLAVTADSPSLPRDDLREARALAAQMGVRHLCISTDEMVDARYVANSSERCYYCKTHLYHQLVTLAQREGLRFIVDGNNADDLRDIRPGRRAAQEYGVRSPLQEAGLTKAEIREWARELGLPNWNKPAAACLSSRIPYGTPITLDALARVERAESFLRALGVGQVRVRYVDSSARIEVMPEDFALVRARRADIVAQLRALGFSEVLLDLAGYRTGSLNSNIPPRVEVL